MENLNQEITRNNIIDMRKSHNYSQKKLAELVGISRTTYNGIENGKVRITIFYVELLADFYNVPVEKIHENISGGTGIDFRAKICQHALSDAQSYGIYA